MRRRRGGFLARGIGPARPSHRRWSSAVAGVAAVVLMAVAAGVGTVSASDGRSVASVRRPAQLPVLGSTLTADAPDAGDPAVVAVNGATGDALNLSRAPGYVLFTTTDWESNVPTFFSSDLVHWMRGGDSLPVLPAWAAPTKTMTWAPSVAHVGRQWVMYVSMEDQANQKECIAAAVSALPAGPYRAVGSGPLVCQAALGGSIDPNVVTSPTGPPRLVWKSNGDCCSLPTGIWEQSLSADGLHLAGSAHLLLRDDRPWQYGNIEGPTVVRAPGGGWWLWYSGGQWRQPTYATGLAWCAKLTGPCQETAGRPWLATSTGRLGPGGPDIFVTHRGVTEMALSVLQRRTSFWHGRLHRWWDRVLLTAPVIFSGHAPPAPRLVMRPGRPLPPIRQRARAAGPVQ
ncbi:MAG: glycoside hydrolase family 43 protein [Acidimicrobiales bacterium]